MKRIVICCDGTWNAPDETDHGVPAQTNVVKVAQAVKQLASDGGTQRMFYDPGVGTSGSFMQRVFDGATGSGLSHNIQEAYRYLIATYEPGDELYFFGFSRGAFTVRSLGGLIRNCGILRRDAADMLERGYALYRSRAKTSHPRALESVLFRRTYSVADIIPIKFIGVWDTVGALGNPLLLNGYLSMRQSFHDTDLSSTIMNAYQALAIDEKRKLFQATMWNKQENTGKQTLEQNWFVGVHSNVGGGYATTGLSDIALQWMADKARACGLDLDDIPAHPDPMQARQESRTGFYRLIPEFQRPIDLVAPGKGPTNERLHASVLERYRNDSSYRPKNLEDYFRRNPQSRPV